MNKSSEYGALAVAFVWFTTHFGGGFSSGRQLVTFYVSHGWYAIFTPFIAVTIMALVYYFAWDFAVVNRTFDYREWGDAFFRPFEKFFSNAYEVMFILILLTATAVAFATGGTVLTQILGTSYSFNTVLIAISMFLLTIFGADVVRGAASIMAVIIITGMMIIYCSNLVVNFNMLKEIIRQMPAPKGFWSALWEAIVYSGFQVCLIGAFVAVADTLKTRRDAAKAAIYGFAVNGILLWLATIGILLHYPAILPEKVPVLYVAAHGGGGALGTAIVSMLILLAVISTGVNLIYGGAKRIVNWWGKSHRIEHSGRVNVAASLIYVVITWSIALFGLIPLIAKGYGTLGVLAIPLIIVPVLYIGITGTKRRAKYETMNNSN